MAPTIRYFRLEYLFGLVTITYTRFIWHWHLHTYIIREPTTITVLAHLSQFSTPMTDIQSTGFVSTELNHFHPLHKSLMTTASCGSSTISSS